uniref:Uncharacterized protein n=1 Tax=Seriola lalandi dorsalis TaxID=1841481 RepID=A0A3B4X1Q4_SERLL
KQSKPEHLDVIIIMDTLPAHLLPLVMEEFPQSLATACVCRAGQREPRLRCVQCGIIEEEEEDCSTLEEDQAQRSFLQTVESLRRTCIFIVDSSMHIRLKLSKSPSDSLWKFKILQHLVFK